MACVAEYPFHMAEDRPKKRSKLTSLWDVLPLNNQAQQTLVFSGQGVLAHKTASPPWRDDDKDGHYMFELGDNLTPRYKILSKRGNGSSSSSFDVNTSYAHLYKLSHGLTNAVIQDISFSDDSHWIAISSSRGTSHLFAISPFGGVVSLHTHEGNLVDKKQGLHIGTQSNNSLVVKPWAIEGQSAAPSTAFTCYNLICCEQDKEWEWWLARYYEWSCCCGNSSKDELWDFSPSGHVIQYSLRLSNGVEIGYCSDMPFGISGSPCEPILEQHLRVVVETLRKWTAQRSNRKEEEGCCNNCSSCFQNYL